MRKNVPPYARTSGSEYTRLRTELTRTAKAAGYDPDDVWNLMIDEIEKRHANVLRGKAKNELTLAQAVAKVQKEAVKVRMETETERLRETQDA